MTSRLLIGTVIGIGLSSAALAQSFTAPAGIPAVTAPGGAPGYAAFANRRSTPDGRVGVVDADGKARTAGAMVQRRYPQRVR